MKPTFLFFVRADNEDGESLDLLVIAKTEAQAVHLWYEYFCGYDDGVKPMWVAIIPGVTADAPVGPIPWSTINPDPMRGCIAD